MLACLVSPTRAIARERPEVQQTVFVDDRALTARRVPALLQAVAAWRSWSRRLGLVENLRKLQFLARSQAQVADVQRLGWGAHLMQVVAGGSAHCEADRRVECLGRRPAFFHVLCTPKASWGWIPRSPSQRMIRPMRAAYKALASAHQMGSSPLQRLLEGRGWVAGLLLLWAVLAHSDLRDWQWVECGPFTWQHALAGCAGRFWILAESGGSTCV
eukprot:s6297_g5.t1